MSLKKKTFSGIAWLSLANLANQAMTFIVFVLLARQLDLHDFGIVTLAVLTINIFTMFFKVGVVEYLVKLESWDEQVGSTAFWLTAIGGCLLTGLLAGVVGPGLERFWGGGIADYIAVLSAVVLFGCLSIVNLAMVRRHFRFRVSAMRNFGAGLLTGVIAIAMALAGFGAWSLVISRVLGALGGAIILWASEPYRPRLRFSFRQSWAIARFSAPVLYSRFLNYLASRMPELMLGALIGPAAVAIYRVGGRIVETINALFLDSIINVLVTTFAKVGAKGVNRAFPRVIATLCAVMIPVFVGCAVTAPELTTLFYGSKWQQSCWVMMLLCLQIAPLLLRSVMGVVFTSLGKGAQLSWLALVELALCALLTSATAFLGPVAVAAAMLVSVHIMAALYLRVAERDLDLSITAVLASVRPFAVSASVMGLSVVIFNLFTAAALSPLLQLTAAIGLGAVLYLLLLIVFFPSGTQSFLRETAPLFPQAFAFSLRLLQGLLRIRIRLRPEVDPVAVAKY